ncbi:MAG: PLP-dependent transferase [Chloroflexi bacterium]|nr:PLP-dependent transferase [Chloroflexota bacterium]
MSEPRQQGFGTRAVHAGERPAPPDFIPTTTPIYPASSFMYEQLDDLDAVFGNERPGYVYSRYGNPTVQAMETAIAALEGAEAAIGFGSGMAALHAALLVAGAGPGARIIASRDLYGATYALLGTLFQRLGVETTYVDITDLAAVEQALAPGGVRAIVFETVSNPLLRVADVPALTDLARRAGALSICDNTFASPYLCRPVEHGVDLIVHSTTKYLGGHGDVMGGVVCCTAARRLELLEIAKMTGGICGPFEAWLVLRGLKTLPLRMRQHSANAHTVARHLSEHTKVTRVNYPGLPSHPQHALASQLLRHGYGGMLSFEIAGAGQSEVFRFMEALRLTVPAPTLGDVYTLTLYPAHSSHRALTPAQRAEVGISEGLVRFSIGIEDVEDIIADLDAALAAVPAVGR